MKQAYLVVTGIVLLLFLVACGGSSGGSGDSSSSSEAATLNVRNPHDYLMPNETIEVDIYKSLDKPLATDISESELNLDIITGDCNPVDPLCTQWRVTPRPGATPASYHIGVDYLDSLIYVQNLPDIDFTLLPALSTPAAVDLAIGPVSSMIIDSTGEVWAIGNVAGQPHPDIPDGVDSSVNQLFRTGITNASKVFSYNYSNTFYVLHRDGTATYVEQVPGTSSFRSFPVTDEAGEIIGNINSFVVSSYALVGNMIHTTERNIVSPPDPNYTHTYDVVPEKIIQMTRDYYVDQESTPRKSTSLVLTLHDDGKVWQGWSRDIGTTWVSSGYYMQQTLLSNIVQVGVGYSTWSSSIADQASYGIALRDDGTVWVWVPYPDITEPEGFPHQVAGLTDIVEIAAKGSTLLARDAVGDIWQVDVDTIENGIFTYSRTATRVPGISNARTMAVGTQHAMAILGDCNGGGTVRSWGLVGGIRPLGDGVRVSDYPRQAFESKPVIGIGGAEASCPRKVLFYKSGNTKGSDITVTSGSGNMECDAYLCWEPVDIIYGATNRSFQIESPDEIDVTPHWDCEGVGDNFSLRINASDVYCKLTTTALRLDVDQRTEKHVGSSTSYVYDALGHTITTLPVGLFSLAGDQREGHAILPAGSHFQLVATPAAGYSFSRWEGSDCGRDGNVTLKTHDIECKAVFIEGELPEYTLTVNIEGGPNAGEVLSDETPSAKIQCVNRNETNTTCSALYTSGSEVNLMANAAVGFDVSWSGCTPGLDTDGEPICSLYVDANQTVTATFSPTPAPVTTHQLSVVIEGGPDAGEVRYGEGVNPQLFCINTNETTTTCTATYEANAQITFYGTAYANGILSWSGCTETLDMYEQPICTLNMDADRTVVASFAPTNMLTVTIRGGSASGTVVRSNETPLLLYCYASSAADTTCNAYYPVDAEVLLTWNDYGGYGLQSWEGCTPQTAPDTGCTLTMDADRAVTATFGP